MKWLENEPFDDRDLARLITRRSRLPGANEDTPLLAVARCGSSTEGVPALAPEDLLAAWA